MESNIKVVALVSGGFDSAALIQTLLREGRHVLPLYVRGGLHWEAAELRAARQWLAALVLRQDCPELCRMAILTKQSIVHPQSIVHRNQIRQFKADGTLGHRRLDPLAVLSVPLGAVYGRHWSVTGRGVPSARSADAAMYLPGRNVFLLSQAMLYAVGRGAQAIALGALASNPFRDATPAFFASFARCLSQALGQPMRVLAPLRHLTKSQLIRQEPTVPYHLTMSCVQPRRGRHCGRCNKCAERRRAFRHAGVLDPTTYVE